MATTKRISQIALEVAEVMPQVARRIHFDILRDVSIPPTQLFVIMYLEKAGRCRLSDLARALNVSAPTVTGLVARAEKGGYLKRSIDPSDRRAMTVCLTAKGSRLASRLVKGAARYWSTALSSLSAAEQENFLKLLNKIKEAV